VADRDDWQVIPGSKGYEVSRSGDIRRGSRMLKPYPTRGGYLLIGIDYEDGVRRRRLVHQVVCEVFKGRIPLGYKCCHENGSRSDNRESNLRYGTRTENMADQYRHGTRVFGERAGRAKLTQDQAIEVRRRVAAGEGQRALGREYGISHTQVGAIGRGDFWKLSKRELHNGR